MNGRIVIDENMQLTKLGIRRKEICKRLGISERMLDRMRELGTFPPPDMKIGSKILVWLPSTFDKWVTSQTGKSE